MRHAAFNCGLGWNDLLCLTWLIPCMFAAFCQALGLFCCMSSFARNCRATSMILRPFLTSATCPNKTTLACASRSRQPDVPPICRAALLPAAEPSHARLEVLGLVLQANAARVAEWHSSRQWSSHGMECHRGRRRSRGVHVHVAGCNGRWLWRGSENRVPNRATVPWLLNCWLERGGVAKHGRPSDCSD
jgi:hypothetical protein